VKVLTLRGLDEETATRLREAATESGRSMNALVLEFVRAGLGIGADARPP